VLEYQIFYNIMDLAAFKKTLDELPSQVNSARTRGAAVNSPITSACEQNYSTDLTGRTQEE
jgi:hypothetical protein